MKNNAPSRMPNEMQRVLANSLRRHRHRLGLSQSELAERCNLSSGYVGDIETCRKFPSEKVLQRICDGLALKPVSLFADDSLETAEDAVYESEIVSSLYYLRDRLMVDIDRTFNELDQRRRRE